MSITVFHTFYIEHGELEYGVEFAATLVQESHYGVDARRWVYELYINDTSAIDHLSVAIQKEIKDLAEKKAEEYDSWEEHIPETPDDSYWDFLAGSVN